MGGIHPYHIKILNASGFLITHLTELELIAGLPVIQILTIL